MTKEKEKLPQQLGELSSASGHTWTWFCNSFSNCSNITHFFFDSKVKVKWSRYRPGVAQRVRRVIILLFHDRDTRRGWVVSSTPRPHFTPGKDPVLILLEAGLAPGPVWTGGKSRPHRDSIPDRPTRSQSLYRLSYPAHIFLWQYLIKTANLRILNFVVNLTKRYQKTCMSCVSVLERYDYISVTFRNRIILSAMSAFSIK